jgi:hypothetical protein
MRKNYPLSLLIVEILLGLGLYHLPQISANLRQGFRFPNEQGVTQKIGSVVRPLFHQIP